MFPPQRVDVELLGCHGNKGFGGPHGRERHGGKFLPVDLNPWAAGCPELDGEDAGVSAAMLTHPTSISHVSTRTRPDSCRLGPAPCPALRKQGPDRRSKTGAGIKSSQRCTRENARLMSGDQGA